jgi:protease-4
MNETSRGPIARFFKGLWDTINFSRRLVFNIIFVGLVLLVIGLFASGEGAKPLAARTTLVVAPEGRLVEQYSSDPASRALARLYGDRGAGEVQLRDLLRAFDAAAKDKRIERVLLRTDGLAFQGYASVREVADALRKLRASGKQVVAFGEGFDQWQYLLAAQANEVYLDPMGGLLLEGLGRYRQYYREGLQDKLGVDVHLFRVGEYKSAAEPFILDAASPESKEADLFWMNDVWQRYVGDVAKARKLAPAGVAAGIAAAPEGIEAAGGDMAQYALQQKLVDGLKTEQDIDDLMAQRGVADDSAEDGFREIDLAGYLRHIDRGI